MRPMRVKTLLRKFILYVSMIGMMIVILFPLYWMFISSIKPVKDLYTSYSLIPEHVTLFSFQQVLMSPIVLHVRNSTLVALGAAALAIFLGTLASLATMRFKFKGRNLFLNLLIVSYMFQGFLLVLPLVDVMTRLGLYDNLGGLAILHTILVMPFIIWMLRAFFGTIPVDLEEAAMIDGTSRLGAFWRVTLPLSAPGLATAAIFAFLTSWNEYMFALVMLVGDANRTIPLGLAASVGHYSIDWATLNAGSVIAVIPGFIFFLLIGKYFEAGLVSGAVKA